MSNSDKSAPRTSPAPAPHPHPLPITHSGQKFDFYRHIMQYVSVVFT